MKCFGFMISCDKIAVEEMSCITYLALISYKTHWVICNEDNLKLITRMGQKFFFPFKITLIKNKIRIQFTTWVQSSITVPPLIKKSRTVPLIKINAENELSNLTHTNDDMILYRIQFLCLHNPKCIDFLRFPTDESTN